MMPLRFNMLLSDEDIDPGDVRLLRHHTSRIPGRTPYTLWRDDVDAFVRYQSTQDPSPRQRSRFNAPYWASFVVPPEGGTMFVGLYEARVVGSVAPGTIDPLTLRPVGEEKGLGAYDQYDCRLMDELSAYIGRLFVDWGYAQASRAWVQRSDRQDKEVIELRTRFTEERFPGFTRFVRSLSDLEAMPLSWKAVLSASKGVYLLACPGTSEHYVGSAYGQEGFLGRWREYLATGHGGNRGLRERADTDWLVSILEVAGSNATTEDIIDLENVWKVKLHSRSMGLNFN